MLYISEIDFPTETFYAETYIKKNMPVGAQHIEQSAGQEHWT